MYASCIVLLICWFFLILCSHRFFKFVLKGYVLSGEIALENNNYYYYYYYGITVAMYDGCNTASVSALTTFCLK